MVKAVVVKGKDDVNELTLAEANKLPLWLRQLFQMQQHHVERRQRGVLPLTKTR